MFVPLAKLGFSINNQLRIKSIKPWQLSKLLLCSVVWLCFPLRHYSMTINNYNNQYCPIIAFILLGKVRNNTRLRISVSWLYLVLGWGINISIIVIISSYNGVHDCYLTSVNWQRHHCYTESCFETIKNEGEKNLKGIIKLWQWL